MSVILETPTKDILMLCKGADSHVIPRCITGPAQETLAHIDKYAMVGLLFFNFMIIFPYFS